ncbi:MAG: tetratricopeptide repeat protein, partial [Usitatibacteraceae bacterium]
FDKRGSDIGPEFSSAARSFLTQLVAEYGQFADARKIADAAYAPFLNSTTPTEERSPVIRASLRYGLVLQNEGDYRRSSEALNRAVALGSQQTGILNPDSLSALRLLALNDIHQGKADTAVATLLNVIGSDKSVSERYGAQRHHAQAALAMAYLDLNKFSEAEIELRAATERLSKIAEDEIPTSRPAAAQIESLWGTLKLKRGDAATAATHFQRSIDILTPRQHPDSPFLANARANLALAMATKGERDSAKALAAQARDSFAKHAAVGPHLTKSLAAAEKLLGSK